MFETPNYKMKRLMPIFHTNKDYGEPGMKVSSHGDLFYYKPITLDLSSAVSNNNGDNSWTKPIIQNAPEKETGSLSYCNCGAAHPPVGYYAINGVVHKNESGTEKTTSEKRKLEEFAEGEPIEENSLKKQKL